MDNPKSRFRLRWNEKVVGYSKKINNSTFYSKDNYGWGGHEIEHNIIDSFAGLFDLNRRAIYSGDIIEFRNNAEHKYALVVLDEILDQYHLLTADGEELISNDAVTFLNQERYVWKSYQFIQHKM